MLKQKSTKKHVVKARTKARAKRGRRVTDAGIALFIDCFAREFVKHLSPRDYVEVMIAPSWDVGRLIKWALREALEERRRDAD
jgi:hypothetical protein